MTRRTILIFIVYLLAALLAAALGMSVAVSHVSAQVATPITILVRDLDGKPIAGIVMTVIDGSDQEQRSTTDAQGSLHLRLAGTSVWLRAAKGTDGTALEMDSNTADGGLRLPLDGTPLVLAFMLDGHLLFRAPAVLDNPAFPEMASTESALVVAGAATQVPTMPTSVGRAETPGPQRPVVPGVAEGGIPVSLLIMLGIIGLGLLILLVVWLGYVWRYRQGQKRGPR
jgi:hypothetical protein